MKALNVNMRQGQSGFTIIELIVVILLLGILTATALPRFLDVTDEAHAAVVDAVRGGLGTGTALYRAQFMANGEPTDAGIVEYGGNFANATGYPIGTGTTIGENADCALIYTGLLQPGRPSHYVSVAAVGTIVSADVTAAGNNEIIAKYHSGDDCHFAYIGQFTSISNEVIPLLIYDASTGAITTSNL